MAKRVKIETSPISKNKLDITTMTVIFLTKTWEILMKTLSIIQEVVSRDQIYKILIFLILLNNVDKVLIYQHNKPTMKTWWDKMHITLLVQVELVVKEETLRVPRSTKTNLILLHLPIHCNTINNCLNKWALEEDLKHSQCLNSLVSCKIAQIKVSQII
jgi:hypothetical protein